MSDADVHESIKEFLGRYVAWSDPCFADIVATWVLHTWAFDEAKTTPYLYVHSPEMQSGKTRLIEVAEVLVRNPMRATDITPAVLFRAIEKMKPTLLLDEVDAIWAGAKNEAMRGMINGGYKKGGSVYRLVGGDPQRFSTFAPKLLAGIHNGHLPDTIADRCIPVLMLRRREGQEVHPFYPLDLEEEIEGLLGNVEQWVGANATMLGATDLEPMADLSDRQWEIAMPLVAIGEAMGRGRELRSSITTAFQLTEQATPPSADKALLTDIQEVFEAEGGERIFTATVLEYLGREVWTPRLLAAKLGRYNIHPTTLRIGNSMAKGYYRRDFETVWETEEVVS